MKHISRLSLLKHTLSSVELQLIEHGWDSVAGSYEAWMTLKIPVGLMPGAPVGAIDTMNYNLSDFREVYCKCITPNS